MIETNWPIDLSAMARIRVRREPRVPRAVVRGVQIQCDTWPELDQLVARHGQRSAQGGKP